MAKEGEISPATVEERLASLERKMRENEALVKGLTDELLDLKSVAMRLTRFSEERRTDRLVARPAPQGGAAAQPAATVVLPKRPAAAPAAAPQAPAPDKMDMIIQPDGTMKLEKRRGDEHYIVASAGNAAKIRSKQNEPVDPKKRGDLIVAEEDEKAASKKS
ncbi:MAG: hypothetical protein LUQ25_07120 [Methanoregulaceae archaeon]|nr:hypothetical protein [Methanoregulaceae archaeon]